MGHKENVVDNPRPRLLDKHAFPENKLEHVQGERNDHAENGNEEPTPVPIVLITGTCVGGPKQDLRDVDDIAKDKLDHDYITNRAHFTYLLLDRGAKLVRTVITFSAVFD